MSDFQLTPNSISAGITPQTPLTALHQTSWLDFGKREGKGKGRESGNGDRKVQGKVQVGVDGWWEGEEGKGMR